MPTAWQLGIFWWGVTLIGCGFALGLVAAFVWSKLS
jgi:hypothetical protein